MTFDEMEAMLRSRLEALPPAARAELLQILRLPHFDRADAIGTYWGHPETRTFGEFLIDLEEDRTARAVLVGMLRDTWREELDPIHPTRATYDGCSSPGNSGLVIRLKAAAR